ncbi:MAG: hypothetical protein OXH56_07645 [Gemmatimonadetes bacterium]|nr:hypothetical protein [Gemmatimonadota bacterium]
MNDSALDLIDSMTYPIHQSESAAYRALVARCRDDLSARSACLLPGFVTEEARVRMVEEVDRAAPDAFTCRKPHNVYLEEHDDAFPSDHPRRRPQATELDSVAFDQFRPTDGLHRLYVWDPLLSFVADVLDKEHYYRMADPLAALTVNVMHEGQNHGWHFDESEATTTLMLQAPEAGGVFEYAPDVRPADGDGYETVDQVLRGFYPDIRTLAVEPGTLILFVGFRSMHRVTSVEGPLTRYVAVFCYKDRPNVRNSREVQELFYGRTA